MEELSVGSESNLINDRRLKIHEDGPGHVFARASLVEEGSVRVITWKNSIKLQKCCQTAEVRGIKPEVSEFELS